MTDSEIFYSAGFFLTPEEGLPTLMKIAQHAQDSDKVDFFIILRLTALRDLDPF